MPRSEAARVNTLLRGPHAIRENRTASFVTIVLQETSVDGPRGPGRPRNSIVLMKDGELTRAGRAYESASGIQLRPPAPWGGEPFLVGNNQWINVTGHGRKLLSSFIRGREKLTSWGRRWYKEHPEEYVVQVPVQISYRRRDGSTYKAAPSTLPISWHTNLHQQDNRWNGAMLEHIRSKLPDHYTTLSIYEIEVLYDQPPRDWTVSRKRVTIDADGRVRFEAAIDQPLRGYDGRQSYPKARQHHRPGVPLR